MRDQIRDFIIGALREMNYDVSDVSGETVLGPAGLDLESLALADLVVQVEEKYAVKFELDDMESSALMTIDEFTAEVTSRMNGTAVTSTL